MYYLGFDIGGSSTKAALVKDKQILKSLIEDTPDSLGGLFKLIIKMKDELAEGIAVGEVSVVGFAVAGVLDLRREKMLNSPNIGYLNDQPLKKLLEEKLNCSVKLEHDAHCFLLAEKEIGSARGLKNVFYLTLGTGIGGAFMVDGKIISGSHGAAGEIGHMIMDISGELELEDLAANKFFKKQLGVGSMEVRRLIESGDQKAFMVVEEMSRNLGVGIANIINIFDPEAIIIGGGINWAKDFFSVGIETAVNKFVVSPEARRTQILFSELDRFGGALGAALMVENKGRVDW
ncbi:MAG: ROK family protein [Candidatus Portnoybacteria bacterium]|nr:ROK family protein [Candidatus Portnoybacteria bacterium]